MLNLYINDKKVDLDKSVNFPITYQMEDVNSPTDVLSDVSKSISVPETKNNNIIFENAHRSDRNVYMGSLNFAQKYYYELYDDTILISKGYVKFGNIKRSKSGNRYTLTLFGQASDFFNRLDKKLLNELTFPCDNITLNHNLDKTFIKDNWSYNRTDILSSSIHNTINYIPAYTGTYPDFDSSKVLLSGGVVDLPYECDEWMKIGEKRYIEFRSIKQKPAVFVSKIIEGIKNELNAGDTSVVPTSIFKKDFLQITNKNQLDGMGWSFSSKYSGWYNLKAYNVFDKTSRSIVVGMPSNQATTIAYQLRTKYLCQFENNQTYKINFRLFAKNVKNIVLFAKNDSDNIIARTVAIPSPDASFYNYELEFKTDTTLDYSNFSIGIETLNGHSYLSGPEIAMGISSITIESTDENTIKPVEIVSDFFTNKNPYYRDALVTCLPVQEVELADVTEDPTICRVWNTTSLDLKPNVPQSKWINPVKDPNNIIKSVYEGHYIDISKLSYDRGEVIIKGRVYLTATVPAPKFEHLSEYIDGLYPHWNNNNGSSKLVLKMKKFAEFGNNGVLIINLKTKDIKGKLVRTTTDKYNLQFKREDGSWLNYYEFEVNCGRFINNKVVNVAEDLEFEFIQDDKQWNVVTYWHTIFGKRRRRNNYKSVDNLQMSNLNQIDYNISFENKLSQNSTIDRNILFSQDITQMQFLLEYCKLFGLYFDFQKDRNVVNILTRNEFYSQGKVLDWSKKIDKTKDIELNPLIFEHAYINYSLADNDTSTPLERHKSQFDLTYGTQRINTGYGFNEDTYNALDSTIFYPTAMIEQYVLNNKKPLTLPCFSKINGNIREWSPSSFELLFRQGWVNCEKYIITNDTNEMIYNDEYYWNQSNHVADEGYKVNNNFLLPYFSTINGNYVLEMGKPKATWFPTIDNTYDEKTIFDKYHKNFVYDRYNPNTKKLVAYFMLNKFDIISFSFKNFIYYDGVYWVVNKIDFDPTKVQSYKVELISVNDMQNYTSGQNLEWKYESENTSASVTNDTFEKSGGTAKLIIESDTYWTAYADDAWITLGQTAGFGNATFDFTVASNSQSGRTSNIHIVDSYGEIIQSIAITQASTSIIVTLDTIVVGSYANTCYVSFDGVNWVSNISKEFTYGANVTIYAKPNIDKDDKMVFTAWYKGSNILSTENPYSFKAETSITLKGTADPSPYARVVIQDPDENGLMKTFSYDATYQRNMSIYPTGIGAGSCKIYEKPDWVILPNGIFYDKYSTFCPVKVEPNTSFNSREGKLRIQTWLDGGVTAQFVTEILIRQQAAPVRNRSVVCFTNIEDVMVKIQGTNWMKGGFPLIEVPIGRTLLVSVMKNGVTWTEGVNYRMKYWNWNTDSYEPLNTSNVVIEDVEGTLILMIDEL